MPRCHAAILAALLLLGLTLCANLSTAAYRIPSSWSCHTKDIACELLETGSSPRMVETYRGGDRLTLKYDDYMGRRVEKCVYSGDILTSKTLYVYDGFKCVEELDALNNNTVAMRHTWQPFDVGLDVIIATTDATGTSYFLHDANKNVMQGTGSTQNIMMSLIFQPIGWTTCLDRDLISFSSEKYDDNSRLIYYNFRYYHPKLARWTRRDPLETHDYPNLYMFIGNHYTNSYDNLGLHGVPGSGLLTSLPSNPSDDFTPSLERVLYLYKQYADFMECQRINEVRRKNGNCQIPCPPFPETPKDVDCHSICQELYQSVHSAFIASCMTNCKNFKPLTPVVSKDRWWKFW